MQASTSSTYTWSDVYVSSVDACFSKTAYYVSHLSGPNSISYPAVGCAESPCRSVDITLPTGSDDIDSYQIEIHYSALSGATLTGSDLIKTVEINFNFRSPYQIDSGLNYISTITDSDFDS